MIFSGVVLRANFNRVVVLIDQMNSDIAHKYKISGTNIGKTLL
jgi:hypothetical protein